MSHAVSPTNWNLYAECYDALNRLTPYVNMLENVLEIAIAHDVEILDAGCGTGNLTARLSASDRERRITAIDCSDAMLDRARQKCKGASVNFLKADLNEALPFEDERFGAVFCINTLYALKDPALALREFARVLAPDGMLIIVTPKRGYENGLILKAHCGSEKPDEYWLNAHQTPERERTLIHEAIHDEKFAEQFIWVARFNRQIATSRTFHFFTMDALSDLMRDVGFQQLRLAPTYAGQNILFAGQKIVTLSRRRT